MSMDYHRLMLENHTLFSKQVYKELAPYHITSGQPKILEYLAEHDGCVQKEIATACHIEPASVTTILAKMEKDGYLYRTTEDGNRRSLHVYLTNDGREKSLLVKETFRKCEETALEHLTREERDTLLSLLKSINDKIKGI